MISVTIIESNPECHPDKIFANNNPNTKRSSLLNQSFCLEFMIWIIANGARIMMIISGSPRKSSGKLKLID